MANTQTMLMVRAGEGANHIEDYLQKKIVAIGWKLVGNLSNTKSVEQVKEKLRTEYPHFKNGKTNICAAALLFLAMTVLIYCAQSLRYSPNAFRSLLIIIKAVLSLCG